MIELVLDSLAALLSVVVLLPLWKNARVLSKENTNAFEDTYAACLRRLGMSEFHVRLLTKGKIDPGMMNEAKVALREAEQRLRLVTAQRGGASPSRIINPPGRICRAIAQLFTKRARERVLQPTIADTQEEYFEALDCGHRHLARWITFRGGCLFAWAAFLCVAGELLRLSPIARMLGSGDRSRGD